MEEQRKYIAENLRRLPPVPGQRKKFGIVQATYRRAVPKVRGKKARKAEKRARQAARHRQMPPLADWQWTEIEKRLANQAGNQKGRDRPAQAREEAHAEPDANRVERDI